MTPPDHRVAGRFRGFLPVVIDMETGGFDPHDHALLELTAVTLCIDQDGQWQHDELLSQHIVPFPGAKLDPASMRVNGIQVDHPFRQQIAIDEKQAMEELFTLVRAKVREHGCSRAILTGHNAAFDLAFLKAAVERNGIRKNPFHMFSTFDTVSMAGLVYGQTVLSRAVCAAGGEWDSGQAHSARYDAECTATLFCNIVNVWDGVAPKQGTAEGGASPVEEGPDPVEAGSAPPSAS